MRLVTLHDGRQVDSASREWLLETLARDLLGRSLAQRREWLASMEQKGDKAGADELRGVMQALHAAGRHVGALLLAVCLMACGGGGDDGTDTSSCRIGDVPKVQAGRSTIPREPQRCEAT